MKRPWTMDCKPSTNQSSWVWLLVLTFGGAITKSALGLVVKWAPWFHGLFIFAVSALVLHQALKNFGKVFLCVFGTVFAETHQRVSSLLSSKERCAESCNACGNCRGPTGRKFAAVMNWFANFRTSWQHCPSSGPWAFGEGPSAPSRIVLNERSQGEGKKYILATAMPPHILRQGKTSCYTEKAGAHRNAAGNHGRWSDEWKDAWASGNSVCRRA